MPKKQGLRNDDRMMSDDLSLDDRVRSDDDNNCDHNGHSYSPYDDKKKGDDVMMKEAIITTVDDVELDENNELYYYRNLQLFQQQHPGIQRQFH